MADVLILDDQPEIRYAIARVLESAGHQVAEACDTAEARELLEGRFDVLICDIQLPLGDGLQLIREASAHRPQTKIVALFGEGIASSGPSLASARALAVNAVLRVPFESETLLDTVERLVPARREHSRAQLQPDPL
jgi:CheY-like chemotaxis protein